MPRRNKWSEAFAPDTETVTVARHDGLTIITDRNAMWDVEALYPFMHRVPDTEYGHYALKGRKLTPATCHWMPDAETLVRVFHDGAGALENAPWATLTDWSYKGFRFVVTEDGRALKIHGSIAELIEWSMPVRATADPAKPLGIYRETWEGETVSRRLAGLVQPIGRGDDAERDPIVAAIIEATLTEAREDRERTAAWEAEHAAAAA